MSIRAMYFNPRSPWGERHSKDGCARYFSLLFQSTLPVGGATHLAFFAYLPPLGFQSTLPVGGATSAWPFSFLPL